MAGSLTHPCVDFEGVFGFDAAAFLGIGQTNGAQIAEIVSALMGVYLR